LFALYREAPSSRLAAIGLDPVAVGIDNESSVVTRAEVRAKVGLSIIAATPRERGLMKGVDTLSRGCGEAKV
jgi:hypothetical protein